MTEFFEVRWRKLKDRPDHWYSVMCHNERLALQLKDRFKRAHEIESVEIIKRACKAELPIAKKP